MLKEQTLQELKRLMGKATPAPWKGTPLYLEADETEDRLGFRYRMTNGSGSREDARHNTVFIAAVRNAAPDLIAEIERLRVAAEAPADQAAADRVRAVLESNAIYMSASFIDKLVAAAKAPVVASGWNSIATAPKDGTEILVWLGAPWSKVEKVCWSSEWANWQIDDMPVEQKDEYCGIGSELPTHWMPLPAEPGTAPASPAAPVAPTVTDGITAAEFIEKRAAEYLTHNASIELDTGALAFKYGEAGRDYHSTLVELAEELRAAAPVAPSPATIREFRAVAAPVAQPADERALFEAWLTDFYLKVYAYPPNFAKDDGSGNHYEEASISNAWTAWQARATLSAQQAGVQEAPSEPVGWSRTRAITDDQGYAIGLDEPDVKWGKEKPEDDWEGGWFPLYGTPARGVQHADMESAVDAAYPPLRRLYSERDAFRTGYRAALAAATQTEKK